uniref:Uncharacterized protein n=1 Tax=Steinernema glaseri TaxID=37863 RepID=A0A1I8AU44_9BILA
MAPKKNAKPTKKDMKKSSKRDMKKSTKMDAKKSPKSMLKLPRSPGSGHRVSFVEECDVMDIEEWDEWVRKKLRKTET